MLTKREGTRKAKEYDKVAVADEQRKRHHYNFDDAAEDSVEPKNDVDEDDEGDETVERRQLISLRSVN